MAGEGGYAVLAEGIAFPEGLAWSAEQGRLFVTGVSEGRVYRVDPEGDAPPQLFADVGGGANNCALSADGGCLVTQNGGIDARGVMARYADMRPLPKPGDASPGLLWVHSDGEVEVLLEEGLDVPNDLAVGDDGALYLTDPGDPFARPAPTRRVMRLSRGGELSVFATGFTYCNGILPDGESVIVSDRGGVLRLWPDGEREWIVRDLGSPDGMALDEAGRLHVAGGHDGCVYVLEDGAIVETLVTPLPMSRVTNCCFGGPDRRSLFVADAANWSVAVWPDRPAPGRPVPAWSPR